MLIASADRGVPYFYQDLIARNRRNINLFPFNLPVFSEYGGFHFIHVRIYYNRLQFSLKIRIIAIDQSITDHFAPKLHGDLAFN